MANTVDKVLKVAEEQVGYLEKKSSSDLDSKTGNAGYGNWTKFGRDLVNWIGSPYANGVAWCDMFVDWCFIKAYGITDAKKMLGGWSAYTPTSAQYFKNMNRWNTTPKVGDQIFFKNSGGTICHTGIVYAVDKTYVYTIEGNTSGASGVVANGGGVCKKKYTLDYNRIAGYGRPSYDIKDAVKQAKSFDKKYDKIFTAITDVNLRIGPGISYKRVAKITKGDQVRCYGYFTKRKNYNWYLVSFNKFTGYVCGKRVK